jgi:secreted trypsin-like serine protease
VKARGLMLAVFAAVVATLALAGVAWAQAADEDGAQPQVVGGTGVPNGKYPFMASLEADLSARPPSEEQFCGGTLIDRDSVLTAGHCAVFIGRTTDEDTLSFRDVRIVVGVTALDNGQGQARRIDSLSDISIHPRFDLNRNIAYDVAVIELDRPVEGIKPIRLAAVGSDSLENPGRQATVAGWGSILPIPPEIPDVPPDPEQLKFPNRMHEVRLPLVSDAVCQAAYADVGLAEGPFFPELMLCAGAEQRDACLGDSGGPLFVTVDGRRRQIGIVSTGRGCGAEVFPGVYTEVNAPSITAFIRSASAAGGA